MRHVNSAEAPKFPFLSQATIADKPTIFLSGQVGIIPDSSPPELEATAAEQTTRAMSHLEEVLTASGSSLAKLTRVIILHTVKSDYPAINTAYLDYLNAAGIPEDKRPGRVATGAAFLPLDALVEIYGEAEQIESTPALLD